jgi:2'-5' RNA ligase
MMDRAISLNRALQSVPPAPIVLSRTDCLPHVSLAMGCLEENAFPSAARALNVIATTHAPIDLTFTGLSVRSSRTGGTVTSLDLARDPALQALHEAVLRAMAPLLTRDATREMFVDPTSVTESTLDWVNEYRTAASSDRFWPHVTLGMGTLPDGLPLPERGRASRLALCHLGSHCTCRRILIETVLRDR